MRRQTASESVWVVVAAVMTGGCLDAQSAPAAEYIYLGERLVAIERPVVAGRRRR
jgi:hypothetical protein